MRHGVRRCPGISLPPFRRAGGRRLVSAYLLLTPCGFSFRHRRPDRQRGAGVIGFAAVAATTEFWQQEPASSQNAHRVARCRCWSRTRPRRHRRHACGDEQNPFYRRLAEALCSLTGVQASHAGSAQLEHPELPPWSPTSSICGDRSGHTRRRPSRSISTRWSMRRWRGRAKGRAGDSARADRSVLPYRLRGWRNPRPHSRQPPQPRDRDRQRRRAAPPQGSRPSTSRCGWR